MHKRHSGGLVVAKLLGTGARVWSPAAAVSGSFVYACFRLPQLRGERQLEFELHETPRKLECLEKKRDVVCQAQSSKPVSKEHT